MSSDAQFNPAKALGRINESFVENGAKSITDKDLEKVLRESSEIKKILSGSESLKQFTKELELVLALISDHRSREYQEATYWTITIIAFALIYLISPIDLIPNPVPEVGQWDDAAVISLCLQMTQKEIAKYQTWKLGQPG